MIAPQMRWLQHVGTTLHISEQAITLRGSSFKLLLIFTVHECIEPMRIWTAWTHRWPSYCSLQSVVPDIS